MLAVILLQQLPGVPTLSHLQTKTDLNTNFTTDMTVVFFPYQHAFVKSLILLKYMTLIPLGHSKEQILKYYTLSTVIKSYIDHCIVAVL